MSKGACLEAMVTLIEHWGGSEGRKPGCIRVSRELAEKIRAELAGFGVHDMACAAELTIRGVIFDVVEERVLPTVTWWQVEKD